jgi:hypothetical protein
VAGLAILVYYLASIASVLLVGPLTDDGIYTSLGQALAEGQGYRSVHLAGSPVQVKYPPGFPVILSLLWRLGGSVQAVQHAVGLLHPVVVGAAAGLLWWVGRARMKAPPALLALLVILPLLFEASIEYYTIVLSEPWFILGWAGVVVLWALASELEPGRRRLLLLAACGILVAASTLVRTHAIVLVPAMLVGLFARRFTPLERITALGLALAPLGLWHLYHAGLIAHGPVSRLPDEGPYLDWMQGGAGGLLAALLAGVRLNVATYLQQFADYLSGVHAVGLGEAVLLVGGAALGAGFAVRREPLLALSALGGLAIILLWPFAQDRLLLPLLPFLGLATCAVLTPLLERASPSLRRGATPVAALLLLSVLLRQPDVRREAVVAMVENRSPRFFTPGYVLLLNSRYIAHASYWVRANTGPADRLMIDNYPGIYLYSGRRTVPANPTESRLNPSVFAVPGQYLASHILDDSLAWVIIGLRYPGIMRDLDTVNAQCPGVLTWGGQGPNDSRFIFRVRRDEACLRRLAQGSASPN